MWVESIVCNISVVFLGHSVVVIRTTSVYKNISYIHKRYIQIR